MNQLPNFETGPLPRSLRRELKKKALQDRRVEALNDALGRMRHRTEAILVDLEKAVGLLDESIKVELAKSHVRDPSDVEFPMTVKALVTRRNNLTMTIAMLRSELRKRG